MGFRSTFKQVMTRYESLPRQTRLIGSSLAFVFCLAGLYWTDYLEAKFPQAEKEKHQQRLEELKQLHMPTRADFVEARQQAERARATMEKNPK